MSLIKYFFVLVLIPPIFFGCLMKKKSKAYCDYFESGGVVEQLPLNYYYQPSGLEAQVFQDVHFDYNSYNIKDSEKQILDHIYNWLIMRPKFYLLIEGHCDEKGLNAYNMALAKQRTISVSSYLINKGIKECRVQTVSYGKEKPFVNGHDESTQSKNRRVHFLIAELR